MSNEPADSPHRFSADRPLERVSDDQLERASFAERLAADITGWHGKDSLVISLNGAWGSGKTTLKNFIREKLEAKGRPIIVEFNPWAWSGQDKLAEGFFGTLRSRFRQTDDAAETEALAEIWESWERWTKFGAEVSDSMAKALAPLFGGSVVLALLTNNAPYAWMRMGGVTLGIVGVIATSFFAAFPGIATHMVVYARHKAGKAQLTMAQLRAHITAQLERLRSEKRPVVVIIDDIDRLNAEEIRYLFQLVKVNADFPNLVYLLLFQTNIVTEALTAVSADSGEEYLKKIVQVPMDVPSASRPQMQAILIRGLDQIVDETKVKMRWERKRFLDLFEDQLWPYFKTLRDVKRFLGTFDFHYNGQVENGVLQVNPVDLLAVEILRTFDHGAYLGIRDSLGFNLPQKFMRLLMGDKERRKEINVEIDTLVTLATDKAHQDRLRAILKALFPDTLGNEEQSHTERDLRVCHPDHFPRYFEQSADRTATSPSSLHSLFGILGDREKLGARLRELIADKQIEPVLAKIGLYFEEVPAEVGEGFIGALFDVGDALPEATLGKFNQTPAMTAGRMVRAFLLKLPDSGLRVMLLERCLSTTTGHVVPTIAMGLLTSVAEKKPEEASVPETELAPLRQIVVARIRNLATTGEIWNSQSFDLFLFRWRDWAGQDVVNAWLRVALDTPLRKAQFVGSMTRYSIVNGSRKEHYLNGTLLEAFIPLEPLARDIESIPEEQLTKHQMLARGLLARAVQLKAKGHGYSEVREHSDFGPGADND